MNCEKKQWFSLRKVKGGLASVVLLTALFAAPSFAAADEADASQALTTEVAPVATESSQTEVVADSSATVADSDSATSQDQSSSQSSTAEAVDASQIAAADLTTETRETADTAASTENSATTASSDATDIGLPEGAKLADDGTVSYALDNTTTSATLTGFQEGTDHSWYYYDASGNAVTGAQTINGQQLFFAEDGRQVKGAFATDSTGARYYYDADSGERLSSRFVEVSGNWYYLGEDGQPVTGPVQINGQYLYFNADGSQVKGALAERDGHKYYYAPDTGDLTVNTTLWQDGTFYRVNELGVATTDQDKIATVKTSIVLDSYEFGAGVAKVVLSLNQKVTPDVVHGGSQVILAGQARRITNSYVSDENGHVIYFDSSSYVTLELEQVFDADDSSKNASTLSFDLSTFSNKWAETYTVDIDDLQLRADSTRQDQWLDSSQDAILNRQYGNISRFSERGSVGRMNYAAYQPSSSAARSSVPLIVWLHGIGEVGTDINIPLLAADVQALTQSDIQNNFTATNSSNISGAHVLVVQSPVAWSSAVAAELLATIQAYVAAHSDIDVRRIHLIGASNGGGMVVTMGMTYPNYFASLVPVAASFNSAFASSTDKTLTNQALRNLRSRPMWIIQTASDESVTAVDNALPFYKQILQAGASNKWLSYFETNPGSQLPDVTYNGHWSWVPLFNNQVNGVQNTTNARTWSDYSGMVATDATQGGDAKATVNNRSYSSIFSWLNAQRR